MASASTKAISPLNFESLIAAADTFSASSLITALNPEICFSELGNATTQILRLSFSQALQTGGGPNVSDANTTNGLPGRCINCSACLGKPILPARKDTSFATSFTNKLGTLAISHVPVNAPKTLTCNSSPEGPNGTMFQNRSILRAESHPLQLHGFNFFVVEQGSGNFDPNKHPSKFNLFDPIERNTEWCALGGWVAPRFLAHNPVVCMVHVLPPASTHKLGIEDGMD
ncbi:hypothetical protein CUMW_035010 [Citrus unshiu]|nr:hypothetical protein CUMW_035010 [Citrus unshiu]